jgi:hypothetical protein
MNKGELEWKICEELSGFPLENRNQVVMDVLQDRIWLCFDAHSMSHCKRECFILVFQTVRRKHCSIFLMIGDQGFPTNDTDFWRGFWPGEEAV